jgi:hypothetical protein
MFEHLAGKSLKVVAAPESTSGDGRPCDALRFANCGPRKRDRFPRRFAIAKLSATIFTCPRTLGAPP